MIIAIDGPAASGKGTLARRLAAHYGLPHLDSGLLYRAVAKALLDAGLPLGDVSHAVAAARALEPTALNADVLKDRTVGDAASIVAAIAQVREALAGLQRNFAANPAGAVIDGRDIGTVIAPGA
ncbi:MAG TPA: (d)CMP kinase, partial [Xanthobacteraceae bacterium]|nr:(d)CMP kinase [Xanthobacteraceae bacterium]